MGAWTVMTEPAFTVGMLVAIQMSVCKLSQPMLRIEHGQAIAILTRRLVVERSKTPAFPL